MTHWTRRIAEPQEHKKLVLEDYLYSLFEDAIVVKVLNKHLKIKDTKICVIKSSFSFDKCSPLYKIGNVNDYLDKEVVQFNVVPFADFQYGTILSGSIMYTIGFEVLDEESKEIQERI